MGTGIKKDIEKLENNIDLLTFKMDVCDFIDEQIEHMLLRPPMWGGNFAVEGLILLALNVRMKVRTGKDPDRVVHEAFNAFIRKSLEDSTNIPFCHQLEERGISNEFSARMSQFVSEFKDSQRNKDKCHNPQTTP